MLYNPQKIPNQQNELTKRHGVPSKDAKKKGTIGCLVCCWRQERQARHHLSSNLVHAKDS